MLKTIFFDLDDTLLDFSRAEAEALRRAELLGKFDELVTELGYIGVTKQMLAQRLKGELKND